MAYVRPCVVCGDEKVCATFVEKKATPQKCLCGHMENQHAPKGFFSLSPFCLFSTFASLRHIGLLNSDDVSTVLKSFFLPFCHSCFHLT